jgi:hypothetical protein
MAWRAVEGDEITEGSVNSLYQGPLVHSKITIYQVLHNSRHVSVWIYTAIRGTFIEHFETTEEKHSVSCLKLR